MKKLFFVLFALLTMGVVSVSAQQERVVAVPKPAEYFQTRLERLYKAIDAKDQTSVSRYERDLSGAMRQAIEDTGEPVEGSNEARFKKDMTTILTKFDGFSFVTASKDGIDEHLAMMESFLAMMIR